MEGPELNPGFVGASPGRLLVVTRAEGPGGQRLLSLSLSPCWHRRRQKRFRKELKLSVTPSTVQTAGKWGWAAKSAMLGDTQDTGRVGKCANLRC